MRLLVAVAALLAIPFAGCIQPEAEVPPVATATDQPDGPGPLETVPLAVAWPHFPSDGALEVRNGTLLVENPAHPEDRHVVPYTVFRPLVADAQHKVPVLLHSHGFGGLRASAPTDDIRAFAAAGFAVVSFDQRGHGDARAKSSPGDPDPGVPLPPAGPGNGSDVVRFMHPEYEVVDVSALIDEVATWDWVLLDAPGDPRLGGIGYSYGGAFQLMGAILDGRFDAIVPEITWNDIVESLAPNGAVKSAWVDGFYGQGNAPRDPAASANPTSPSFGDTSPRVTFSQEFHAGFAWTMATNTMPQGQAPGVPDLVRDLRSASPSSYPWRLDVPTFLIQGMPDTLFNLNQAVANVELLKATGAPWALHTHLAGHVFNSEGDLPDAPVAIGLQGVATQGRPCGAQANLTIAWHQRHLLGLDVPFGPKVCIALEDGTVATGDDYPLPGTQVLTLPLECVAGTPCVLTQGGGAGNFMSIELGLEEGTVLAGIPRLHARVTSPGADTIVFLSLQKQLPSSPDDANERVIDDQVAALRLAGPNSVPMDVSIDLGGVGTVVAAGETIQLVLSDISGIHLTNAQRLPGAVLFEDIVLELPTVPASSVGPALG